MNTEQKFHLVINQQKQGPFSQEEIRQMLAEGKIQRNTLAWGKGLAEWTELGKTQGVLPEDVIPPTPSEDAPPPIPSSDTSTIANSSTSFPPLPSQIEVSNDKQQLHLWNPNLACFMCLLFPAVGPYIHYKNWQEIGDAKQAATAKNWLIVACIFGCFVKYTFPLFLIWYFMFGKKQIEYVKNELDDTYLHKGWGNLWLIFGLIYLPVYILIFIVLANGAA